MEVQKVRGAHSFLDSIAASVKHPLPRWVIHLQAQHVAHTTGNLMDFGQEKLTSPPQPLHSGARRFGAADNRLRVTTQPTVEDYVCRLI